MKRYVKVTLLGLFLVMTGIFLPIESALLGSRQVVAETTATKTITVFHSLQSIFGSKSFGIEEVTIKPGQKVAAVVQAKKVDGYTFYKMESITRMPSTYEEIGARNNVIYITYRPEVLPPITIHLSHITVDLVELGYERVTVQPGTTVTLKPKSYPGYVYDSTFGSFAGNNGLVFTYDELANTGDELKLVYAPVSQTPPSSVSSPSSAKPTPVPSAPAVSIVPVYRLYNPALQVHLYTTDQNEVNVLKGRHWNDEGISWKTEKTAGSPVYRLYHEGLKVHLYTKDANEYKVLATRGWKQEGVAYRSQGSVAIYRMYHPGIRKHLYTRDANEYRVLASRGWRQEGVAWHSQP